MSADDPASPRPPRDTASQRLEARPGRRAAGRRPDPLAVELSDGRGDPARAPGLATWLADVAPRLAQGRELSIALVDDATMRAMNREYRRRDEVTDVLSFPAEAGQPASRGIQQRRRPRRHLPGGAAPRVDDTGPGRPDAGVGFAPTGQRPALGDIVIARGVAARQARAAGHSLATELRVLALHGLLHLLGYDHDADGGRMARLERRLRRKGGLREGLLEREGAR